MFIKNHPYKPWPHCECCVILIACNRAVAASIWHILFLFWEYFLPQTQQQIEQKTICTSCIGFCVKSSVGLVGPKKLYLHNFYV